MTYQPFGTKIAAKAQEKRKRRRKQGPLTSSEKILIATIADDHPSPQQIESTAVAMRRSPEAVMSGIAKAREKFQAKAEYYVDLHARAADLALVNNDADVARKAAEWAMTNLSGKSQSGDIERIVDRAESASDAPRIQIGINLGGVPAIGVQTRN